VFRRRRGRAVSEETASAYVAFRAALAAVEDATASLASAAPAGRGAGQPLAEAVMGFESGLGEARDRMPGWRAPALAAEWDGCRQALEEAGRRAERLRLAPAPEGYEQLYGALGDLLGPLEAFVGARERFRELGV
jgi:hypothetical protein